VADRGVRLVAAVTPALIFLKIQGFFCTTKNLSIFL
jgi:hypothetical protein